MLFQGDDPIEMLIMQKNSKKPQKIVQNIRLNLNKLPPGFFPEKKQKKTNSYSQRLPTANQN